MQEDMTDRLVRLTKLYDDDSPVVNDPRSMEQELEDFKAPIKKKPPTKVVKSKEDLEEDFKVIEIPIIMKEYEEWIKNNPGKEFREFLKEQEQIRKQDERKFKDIVLAGALGKIDDAMSGIMSTVRGGFDDGGSTSKPKDPATKIKKLNLADYFQYGMKIADLTESEREVVNDLLKRTLSKNLKNQNIRNFYFQCFLCFCYIFKKMTILKLL